MLIYQQINGLSGIANLKATIDFLGAVGNFVQAPTQGLVTLQPGRLYVLFGRSSVAGSQTWRTYATQSVDLLSTNVQPGTHPTTFSTVIPATTAPATFDPLLGVAVTTDVTPVIRLIT